MFEKSIFETILKVWAADQEHPYRDRRKRPLPTIYDLKVIIETSFFTSLKREEDKPVTFAIALLPKHETQKEEKLSGVKQLILTFPESITFNESSIIKLASAFDPRNSALIVGPKVDLHSEYEIWGIMFFGTTNNRFNEIPAAISEYNYFRPDVMMITTISPGSLIISRGSTQIGRFTSGVFTVATPTPFTSRAMGNYIIECIKQNEGYKKYTNEYWHIFVDSIDYLLSEASIRGHGSTIIILPKGIEKESTGRFTNKYSFNQNLQIENIILDLLNLSNNRDFSFRLLIKRLLSERLSFLAQLSCIDGALILDSRLNPISFGATLNSTKWDGKVVIGPDGFNSGGKELDTLKFGTRHNSAINFVAELEGTIGFVISQDGPIRGVVKKDQNTVLYWPDCRVSMFI